MFHIIPVLSPAAVSELREIAASSQFVDGRVSNPHSRVKNNTQLTEPAAVERSAELLRSALMSNEAFRNVTFAKAMAPPTLARYRPDMNYGLHTDAAQMRLPRGIIRADISCTIFLSEPDTYEGGALCIAMGDGRMRFKEAAGMAIVYPSTTLHEVEPVTSGERLVGLTFIQSFIADPQQRDLLYELNEIAAIEGFNMSHESMTRLAAVRDNLLRRWSETP